MGTRADARMLVDGQRIRLTKHPKDFSVLSEVQDVRHACGRRRVTVKAIGDKICRVRCTSSRTRNALMRHLRGLGMIVHHVYVTKYRDEIVLGGHLYLRLKPDREQALQDIVSRFSLLKWGRMGRTEVLAVTFDTEANPVKAATRIAKLDSVEDCSPEFLWDLKTAAPLTSRQWHLAANRSAPEDQLPLPHSESDAAVVEAWAESKGDPRIVVAVIDDGFDLQHPALSDVAMHEGRDFQVSDGVPLRRQDTQQPMNSHGTLVASIAVAAGGEIEGVAPHCTLLPIRLPINGFTSPLKLQQALQFASDNAHIVNVSIEFTPRTTDYFEKGFREFIVELATYGGLAGRGLVIVVSAGNQDCPTFLTADQNKSGLRFRANNLRKRISKRRPVFTGLPNLEHPIVVAATTSTQRKAGYSNWGRDVNVAAPSGNGHELQDIDSDFDVPYPGRGMVAAVSRPEVTTGDHPPRLPGQPLYTAEFVGTSAAAPVVTGIAALMLSVNNHLAAWEVKRIIGATTDRALDRTLDNPDDPNVVDIVGDHADFKNGHSWFFGSGKVNAWKAVRRAKLLADDALADQPRACDVTGPWQLLQGALGIASPCQLGSGMVDRIELIVALRGNAKALIQLVTPHGLVLHVASIHVSGDVTLGWSSDDGDSHDLQLYAAERRDGGGTWSLNLSRLDAEKTTCQVTSWSLVLEP